MTPRQKRIVREMRNVSPIIADAVADMYRAGMTTPEIAAKFQKLGEIARPKQEDGNE